ncbi:MAG: DinB family protein [Acidobacteriia bacterium]|nr:DinB family protein [Terriglobia bacterium]
MHETYRILDQMDRVFSGEAWHGPSLIRLLDGLSPEEASRHPIPGAHSVWELVHHITAWKTIADQRLKGESGEVSPRRDWPPVWEVSQAEWKRALEDLAESHARLRQTAETLKDPELDQKPAAARESRYVLLHGVLQHDLYHTGQIAVLRKALGKGAA